MSSRGYTEEKPAVFAPRSSQEFVTTISSYGSERELAGSVRREIVKSCPVCAAGSHTSLYVSGDWLYRVPGEFKLVRCNECAVVYLQDRPDSQSLKLYYPDDAYYAYGRRGSHELFARTNRLASIWYAIKRGILAHRYNYKHLGSWKHLSFLTHLPLLWPLINRATFQLKVLLHEYVENGSLLEVGCGSGAYLDLMRALGWKRVVGVDFSAKAVKMATDTLGLEVYCGELNEVGLEPDSFDAVSLSHTLEHVPDPVTFLCDVRRVMKPGARLAIIVPNVESLSSRVYADYWLALEPPRHLVNFNRRGLATALERAGFSIETLTTTPRGSYQVPLFSHSRRAGDDHAAYTDAEHRFPIHRRLRALALSMVERVQCALGLSAGEEVMAVAVKPRQ
jgi:SAM-dependent methyltransferase